jgi:hypothetical protein
MFIKAGTSAVPLEIAEKVGFDAFYRGQEKEFHHEEHQEHEEIERSLLFSSFCTSSFLRVLRFFVVLFS